jgi:hypothetical protein
METDTHKKPPEPVTEASAPEQPKRTTPPIPPDNGPSGLSVIQAFMRGEDAGSLLQNEKPGAKGAEATEKKEPANAEDREAQLREALRLLEETPELTYEERLKQNGIDREEAMRIVADMFEHGFHEKTYNVVGTHVTVTFRTRLQEDQDRVLARIESDAPQYPTTLNNLVAKHNLAASVMEFMGKSHREKTVQERYDFISRLPDVVVRTLSKKLQKFDELIMDVMDEGAIANF